MSLGTILLIILVIALLGGFSGLGGGHSSCGLGACAKVRLFTRKASTAGNFRPIFALV